MEWLIIIIAVGALVYFLPRLKKDPERKPDRIPSIYADKVKRDIQASLGDVVDSPDPPSEETTEKQEEDS
jgi:hypothetical protein